MIKLEAQENRAVFLRLFTEELIHNSKKPAPPTEQIPTLEALKEPIIPASFPSILEKEDEQIQKPLEIKRPLSAVKQIVPSFKPRALYPQQRFQSQTPEQKLIPTENFIILKQAEPELGKLNIFLQDRAVTMIECPGPEKFINVKKEGRVNLTKISLSEEEIKKIIDEFSAKARIPVIGGVFKATIGNLTISAVISEFVGTRFILYKQGPYSLLEKSH